MTIDKVSNKPWKNESWHITFEEADSIRKKLIKTWELDKKYEGMQVKVKFIRSKNKFVLKTRLHPDFEIKKEEKGKKSGKSSKRNKKNSSGGMFDPAASI